MNSVYTITSGTNVSPIMLLSVTESCVIIINLIFYRVVYQKVDKNVVSIKASVFSFK